MESHGPFKAGKSPAEQKPRSPNPLNPPNCVLF